jgi:DNA-binding beta-propeller fold protein YncE
VVGPLPSRATIPVGRQPTTVVIGQGAVWVACPQDNLVRRIDPQTNQEVATLRVAQPQDIALGFGAVWVSSERSGTVLRIDPRTNSATPIRVAGKPNAIAVGADAVWVKNSDRRTIQRIDPQTDTVAAALPVASGLYGLAVDDQWLWTVDFPGDTVTRLRVPE